MNNNATPPIPLALPALVLACLLTTPAAQGADPTLDRLVEMSLEELLQVEITSLGKKSQRLVDEAAAVHVISRDDILLS